MNDKYITRGCFNIPAEVTEEGSTQCRCKCSGRNKLDVYNWLESLPEDVSAKHLVEVRFKNTRKSYFINNTEIPLVKGDIVAVEASPGHDVGVVSLVGELVVTQMKRYGVSGNLKKIYRKAKPSDIEKWFQSIEKEPETMRIARQIVSNLGLGMKISDVEYQGDKTKATFYYISDERVDFRQLIKEYADHFRLRVEMKQIGARQEAGKVGGIGTCGRELCCSSWMSSFVSVSTSAARYQEVSLNPQKLAGQCGKLKCCLNYELKCYMDAQSDFPDTSAPLETEQGKAYHRKTDVFRRIIWYSFEKDNENAVFIPLDIDTVKEIIQLNKKGIKAKELIGKEEAQPREKPIGYQNAVGEDSISRFEEKRNRRKKKPVKGGNKNTAKPEGERAEKNEKGRPEREGRPERDRNERRSRPEGGDRKENQPKKVITNNPSGSSENKESKPRNNRNNRNRRRDGDRPDNRSQPESKE